MLEKSTRSTKLARSAKKKKVPRRSSKCPEEEVIKREIEAAQALRAKIDNAPYTGMQSGNRKELIKGEIEAAQAYGSHFVTARQIHAEGVEAALKLIPEGANVVITLDCDGLDPAVMPGVAARTPGGLSYTQVIDLIAGAGKRGRIVGFDLVELYPPADIDGISALTAARLVVNAIGSIIRQE